MMRKVNSNDLPELTWQSPKGKFQGAGKQVSEALGWNADSPSARDRHPFVVEILRVPPGQTPYVLSLPQRAVGILSRHLRPRLRAP